MAWFCGGYRSRSVCYRVRGIACAIFLLVFSMLALALGAYSAGKVAVRTSLPHTGIILNNVRKAESSSLLVRH